MDNNIKPSQPASGRVRRPPGIVPSDRMETTPGAEKAVEKLQHDLEKAKDANRDAEKT